MKKVIAIFALALTFAVSASAQSQNEGYVGVSFLRQNVEFTQTPSVRFNENTDSFGVTAGVSRFTKTQNGKAGVLGVTADLTANFDTNQASLVTFMVGGTAKARNAEFVQPYVRVLGGVARQNVTRRNVFDKTDVSSAFDVGAGLDFKVSTFSVRTGLDFVNTGFHGERQNSGRATVAIVF